MNRGIDLEKYGPFIQLRIVLFSIPLIFIAISIYVDNIKLISFSLIIFLILLLLNAAIAKKENIISLHKGQVRRSIAITFTMAYLIFVFVDPTVIGYFGKHFAYIYGIIIAFYFGSRIFEK